MKKKKCLVHNLFIGNPEDKPAGLWLPSIHFLWTADKLNQSQSLTRSNRYRGAERLGCRLAAGAVALFIPQPPTTPDPVHVSQKLSARVAQSAFIKLRALFLPCHPSKKIIKNKKNSFISRFSVLTEIQSAADHNLFTLGERMSVKRMKTSHYFPRGRGRGGQDKGPQCCLGRLREGFFSLFFYVSYNGEGKSCGASSGFRFVLFYA